MRDDVEVVSLARDELGECPVWHGDQARLSRVDITLGQRRLLDPGAGADEVAALGGQAGFALPRRAGGFVAGVGRRLVLWPERVELGAVEPGRPGNRFNDAICDPDGRLWAGTMPARREPGAAALYRVTPDGSIDVAIAGVGLSNGLDWSADGTTLYYVDSLTQRVDAIRYDRRRGRLGERVPLARVAPEDGLPDGLAVDDEGHLWLALFGGGAVRRYTPDGELERTIELPVTNPTSVAFGGAALDELYVTSARHKLSAAQLAREPLAGAVLRLRPGARGRAPYAFAG